MAAMTWSESFGVGNAMLDSDHRILFNLLNQLHDAVDTGQSRDVVASVVKVLVEYTEHHFAREEALLEQAGFPHLDGHRQAHRALEARVRDIRDRWAAGERQALDEEVLAFLKKWLTDHILDADKSYRPWIDDAAADGGIPAANASAEV